MTLIHPTAIIGNNAEIHDSVKVGPYCIIDDGARIGPDCVLDSHIRIYSYTTLGRANRVCHGATLGSEPQDLGYTPDKVKPLIIGNHNHFKEYVNISTGTKEQHGSKIGDHNYLMTYTHVGHDCLIGDHNVFAPNAAIGGHVEIDHHSFISGQVAVHQFCKIGAYVMIGGVSGVRQDIPPYCMANGQYARYVGVNQVGLKRNGFTPQQRNVIKQAYRILFLSGYDKKQALAKIKTMPETDEIQAIIDFIGRSNRGLITADLG